MGHVSSMMESVEMAIAREHRTPNTNNHGNDGRFASSSVNYRLHADFVLDWENREIFCWRRHEAICESEGLLAYVEGGRSKEFPGIRRYLRLHHSWREQAPYNLHQGNLLFSDIERKLHIYISNLHRHLRGETKAYGFGNELVMI